MGQKQSRQDPRQRSHLPRPTEAEFQTGINEEAERDAFADAEGQRHGDHGDDGWNGFAKIPQIDVEDALHHENSHDDQGWRGGYGWNDGDERMQQEREQKTERHDDARETGARAFLDAGGGLDVSRHCGSPEAGTDHRGTCIGGEGAADFGQTSIPIEQTGPVADTDQSPHVVEKIDEEKTQDNGNGDCRMRPEKREVEFEKSRRERCGPGDQGRWMRRDASKKARDSYGENSQDDGTSDFFRDQGGGENQSAEHKPWTGLMEISQADERCRMAHDDAAISQADEGDEQPDAAGDGEFEFHRNGVHQFLANAGDREQEKHNSAPEDHAERGLPGDFHRSADGEGEERIQTHARGESQRVVGEQRHRERHDGRGECCRGDECAPIHSGDGQNRGIHRENVGHRGEGRETSHHFAADGGAVFLELKKLL